LIMANDMFKRLNKDVSGGKRCLQKVNRTWFAVEFISKGNMTRVHRSLEMSLHKEITCWMNKLQLGNWHNFDRYMTRWLLWYLLLGITT
jgi:hypothetical protein